jgi:hypothetical protein
VEAVGLLLTGRGTFVPNASYSGSPKQKLSALTFVPYTSPTAEYTAEERVGGCF